ncbi:MAG: SDR family oxidoreductase [Candidatus Aureabacteria bacterium]|nr:SDR family oxidoreductase [Candidatus Auribacterota bacterium]
MTYDFRGRKAVISGGTRGIGRAVTEAFLKAGATAIVTYRSNEKAASEFKSANESCSGRLELYSVDCSDSNQTESFFHLIQNRHGSIDILVHSAGVRNDSVLGMMTLDQWHSVIDTNLNGTFNMARGAVLSMMPKRYGRILFITSAASRIGFQGQTNYTASKAGQIGLMRSLSRETATRGITVNCISPGFIQTDFLQGLDEEHTRNYKDLIPLKRFGSPKEVADLILFLASEESSYITGAAFDITGGL